MVVREVSVPDKAFMGQKKRRKWNRRKKTTETTKETTKEPKSPIYKAFKAPASETAAAATDLGPPPRSRTHRG